MKVKPYLFILVAASTLTAQPVGDHFELPGAVINMSTIDSNSLIGTPVWQIEKCGSHDYCPVKQRELHESEQNLEALLGILEKQTGLIIKAVDEQRAVFEIEDAVALTQQGSMNAEWKLAEIVYTITELSVYEEVNLRFEEGDHTGPGSYTRSDFERI